MNDPEPSRGNKVRRGSLLRRLREAVRSVKWLLHFRVAAEQPPQSFELNNEASNYGAQGTFYGPVSFEQNFGISKKRLSIAYIQVIFERYPRYPLLNFSVINSGEQPVQITSIRIIKAVSMKDEHGLERYLLGPRTKLEFSLRDSPGGTWVQAFGSDIVSNLNPGEAEAFQLRLDCENTINLLDLEVNFLSSNVKQTEVYIPSDIIIVHSPLPSSNTYGVRADGHIAVTSRKQAFQVLVDETELDLWEREVYADCNAWRGLLIRASGYLCRDSLEDGWNILHHKFKGTETFGPVLASFAELLYQPDFPNAITEYLLSWIQDPSKVSTIPIWDEESHASIIFQKLLDMKQKKSKDVFCLKTIDSLLYVVPDIDIFARHSDISIELDSLLARLSILSLSSVQGTALGFLTTLYGIDSVEYLISFLPVSDMAFLYCHDYLSKLVQQDTSNMVLDSKQVIAFWQSWWAKQRSRGRYTSLQWREYSPQLLKAFQACDPSTALDILVSLSADKDAVVRQAVAQNPTTPTAVLEILARDPLNRIRATVAEHPNVSVQILRLLASDPSIGVRSRVIGNPNTDVDTLTLLAKGDNTFLKEKAVRRLEKDA